MKKVKVKNAVFGTILGAIGFLLSPLSWWNDLIINVPLAFIFAFCLSKFFAFFGFTDPGLFLVLFTVGYWITNIAGFILMHHGFKILKGETATDHRHEIRNSILWSLAYTILIVAVVRFVDVSLFLEKYLK